MPLLSMERVYRRERNRDGGIVELYSLEMIAALAFRLKSEIQKLLEDSRKKCIGGQEWV